MPSRVPSGAPKIPSAKRAVTSSVQASALSRGVARFVRQYRPSEPRFKLFWQTVAVAASMLLFSLVRPSSNQLATAEAMQSTGSSSGVIALRGPSSSETPPQQTELLKPSKAELHASDYPVAKDFTNHLAAHRHNTATVQKSGLTRNQPEVLTRRVIIN